jgi:4-alpha-glucanotransferase
MPAREGVYVRYRADELYAVLCLESQRHQTTLIGENLGTVPREVNGSLAQHGVRKMFVAQYEIESVHPATTDETIVEAATVIAAAPPSLRMEPDSMASVNTHDMPTFAAWWRGLDIPLRRQLGLLTDEEAQSETNNRAMLKLKLAAELQCRNDDDEATVLAALLHWLAASDAEFMLVNLEDLWLELQPQNVPGTGAEMPNWSHKAVRTFEEFSNSPAIRAVLETIAKLRKGKSQ